MSVKGVPNANTVSRHIPPISWLILIKCCTETYKQVYYQLFATIFDITLPLHVSATVCSHLPGTVLLEDISGVVLW